MLFSSYFLINDVLVCPGYIALGLPWFHSYMDLTKKVYISFIYMLQSLCTCKSGLSRCEILLILQKSCFAATACKFLGNFLPKNFWVRHPSKCCVWAWTKGIVLCNKDRTSPVHKRPTVPLKRCLKGDI